MEALFKAAERIQGDDAATIFINEILTESEKITIGRRILIANMILMGYKQSEIHNQLGVSPNTFSRIRQWLSGSFPNYNQSLKNSTNIKRVQKLTYEKPEPFSFKQMQQKYPLHSLLFTLSEKTIKSLKEKN